jgi:Tfp pilus assembly PilM family ATPase
MKIKLFNKPDKIITVLEIGKKWFKIVQAERLKTENRICFIDAFETGFLSDEDLMLRIVDLSKKRKIDSENLIVSIPHIMTSTKNLDLPSTNPSEIEDMVDLQIGKQTPYSSDEIIKDYHILDSHMEGYSRVLLVIVHRDVVQRCFKILEGAGLSVEKVGFSSEGLLGWGSFVCTEAMSASKTGVLIDIDHDTIDFEVVANGSPLFNRSLSLGLSDASLSGPAWQNKFVEEVTRAIYAYQNEVTDREVEKVVISAGLSARQKLDEAFLREKIALPVEIIDQLGKLSKTDSALASYNSLSAKNLSFSSLFGTTHIFDKQVIDLVPQEVRMERSFKERGKDIYRIGIISVFILLLVSSLFLGRLYNKERYLNQLNAKLSEIKDNAAALSSMARETALVRGRVSTRGMALDLLHEVYKAVLPELHLTMVVFDGKENMILRGDSNIMSEVFNFVSKLEESEYFKNVQARNTTQRRDKDKEVVSFEILCPLDTGYINIERHKL